MLNRSHHSAALLLLAAATLACPSNETFDSLGDTPATTTATTATTTGASDSGSTGSSGAPDTEPTSSSTTGASTTDASTTDASTGTTGEPSNLCPEHTTTDACCCFEAHMGTNGYVSTVCGTQSLCTPAEFECDQESTCTAVDEKTIDCVLAALMDGTMVGSLKVNYDIDSNYGERTLDLYLQGDGSAYVVDSERLDLGGSVKPSGRYVLREAAYFQECLMGDAQAKSDCLANVLGDKASEVCTEGFDFDVF